MSCIKLPVAPQQMRSSAVFGSVSSLRAKPFCAHSRPARISVPVIENRVAIRFQRYGRHKAPFYRIVALDSRKRRDYGEPLEYLGWYDPLKKETSLNAPAIKKWLTNGAQPTETVRDLLKKAEIIEPGNTRYDSRRPPIFKLKQAAAAGAEEK